jgi:hypothetical protein
MENTNGKLIREVSTFSNRSENDQTHRSQRDQESTKNTQKADIFLRSILLTKCKYQTQMEKCRLFITPDPGRKWITVTIIRLGTGRTLEPNQYKQSRLIHLLR